MGTVSGLLNCIKTLNISIKNVKADLHVNKKKYPNPKLCFYY